MKTYTNTIQAAKITGIFYQLDDGSYAAAKLEGPSHVGDYYATDATGLVSILGGAYFEATHKDATGPLS